MAQSQNSKKTWVVRIGLAVILIAALLISLIWADTINAKFGLTKSVKGAYNGEYNTQDVLTLGGDLNVHFVDVGQGDACIIELPDERTMLIDAGDTHTENKQKLLSYIEDNINDENGNDIEYFDFVILTHPDSDHCGGMADVLNKYPAKVFYRPNVYSVYKDDEENDDWKDPEKADIKEATGNSKNNEKNTRAYDNALKAGYNENNINGIESQVYIIDATDEVTGCITPEGVNKGDADYYEFNFYGADKTVSYKDNNNYSPVMILEYHGKRFMLSGDAEKDAEADFVKKAKAGEGKYAVFTDNFTVDVFKLGHHGSRTSSSEDMIRVMTTPENRPNIIAVVSCGEDNSYGHPHKEVLDRLSSLGFADKNIVRTDENGTVAMSVTGVENDGGTYRYELRMGAETVTKTAAAIGNDKIHLTWFEIVVLGIGVVIIILIIMPAVTQTRKKARSAARKAGIDADIVDDVMESVLPDKIYKTNRSQGARSRTVSRKMSSSKNGTKRK